MDIAELRLGAVVELKKTHPCGGTRWEIVRTGADRKIKCLVCGRTVVLSADGLAHRAVRIISEERA